MNDTNKTIAIAYTRVATTKQANKNNSLEAQKQQITEYASQQNIEIVKWYEEVASGVGRDRPILKRAVKYCYKRFAEIDRLIATEPNRIARSIEDFGYWEDEFTSAGTFTEFLDEDNARDEIDDMRGSAI